MYHCSDVTIVCKQNNHGFQNKRKSLKPGFHYTANATTTTQKQNDYKAEHSSFTPIALF